MRAIVLGCLAAAAAPASAATVYDTLGTTDSVMASGGEVGILSGTEYEQGLEFGVTQTVKLTTLDVSLVRTVSGLSDGPAVVQLRLDNAGVPGRIVESFTTPTITATSGVVQHLNSSLGTTLAPGQLYWVTLARAPGSTFGGAWNYTKQYINNYTAWRTLPLDWSTMVHRAYGTRITGDLVFPGDANQDGTINLDDFALLDRGALKHLSGWNSGDFTGDGVVDVNDYRVIDVAYGQQQGGLSPAFLAQRQAEFGTDYVASLIAAVPEPASLAACGFALLPLTTRRRRK